jgi:hypothetical protein
MNNPLIGTRRKTGDKFDIEGWWVECSTKEVIHVPDIADKVPPSNVEQRYIFIYAGTEKPNDKEVDRLIQEYGGKWGTHSTDT